MTRQFLPLRQIEKAIPLLGLETRHAEPARLAVVAGSGRRAHHVPDHFPPRGGRLQLRLKGQAPGDNQTGDRVRGRGAEGARGGEATRRGSSAGTQERTESLHFECLCVQMCK